MASASASPETAYPESVEGLAGRVLDTLLGVQDAAPARDPLDGAAEHKTALAAIRVLGPDLFVPPVLTGATCLPDDVAAVAAAFRVFPPARADVPAEAVLAWRDWATAHLLARYGGDDLGLPQPPGGCAPTHPWDWRAWSVRMAQLSPLALPGLDSPVHDAACDIPVALSQGLTRAMLRRDYPTAARLVRWLALVCSIGGVSPVDPGAVVAHLELLGGGGARTTLDLT
ncbi:MAG: hypothetical protein M3291_10675, partial [Actinomycetota bacterium]|nr:hypothetical protein [Actinomycetota bacterium]